MYTKRKRIYTDMCSCKQIRTHIDLTTFSKMSTSKRKCKHVNKKEYEESLIAYLSKKDYSR